MEEVGRSLIRCVDGVRTLLPPDFTRLAPVLEANQTLAELADLLDAQGRAVSQDDAGAVGRDFIHIPRLMGPVATLKHLKSSANLKGHRLLSPLEVLEATYRDWKAHLAAFAKPKLLPPEKDWLAKFDSSQVNLPKRADRAARNLGHQAIIYCEAWINLVRRRNSRPGEEGGWQWQKDSKSWRLLQRVADLVRLSIISHTVFAPPALQDGSGQRPCSSLKEVRQWSEANEIDEHAEWKRGNEGLEFRCQLNTRWILARDPPHSIPEALSQRSHKSGRDREASQRHIEELKRSCKNTKASKVKGSQVQVS